MGRQALASDSDAKITVFEKVRRTETVLARNDPRVRTPVSKMGGISKIKNKRTEGKGPEDVYRTKVREG